MAIEPVEPLALRPREAAKALGISPRFLWQLTQDGQIPCVRIGSGKRKSVLYPWADLQAWLDNREEELAEQAQRLVTREQELDRQERHFRQVEQKLSAERREQQQELRRLLSQIRASQPA